MMVLGIFMMPLRDKVTVTGDCTFEMSINVFLMRKHQHHCLKMYTTTSPPSVL